MSRRVTETHWKMKQKVQVIVVPWVSRVYGICTLKAVICIPEGAAGGNTYNCTKSTNSCTLADLYHNTITNAQLVMTSTNGEALVAWQPYTLGYIDSSNEPLGCMADIPWAVPFM